MKYINDIKLKEYIEFAGQVINLFSDELGVWFKVQSIFEVVSFTPIDNCIVSKLKLIILSSLRRTFKMQEHT